MDSEKLSILLKEKENLTLEFKERYTTKVDEDIVAFANTKGGVLILGVSNDGSVIGQKLTNEIKAQVNNLARNCSPSIEVRLSEIQSVFVIEVAEGKEKPYSCGSGYFRRLDGNTQKMTHDEVRIMFGEYEQTPFEEKINKNCLLEDISTDKVKRYMNEAKITDASQNIKETLSSANVLRREQVKNAGILLFAKQVVKFIPNSRLDLIRFKGKDKVNIFDRMEVNDDLLTQFDQAMFFLKKHLNTRSEIKGVNRYDILEIPE
ncbi:MAG TPA: RNA-binding domain-containing protein, partial [archaeon]|nr:RNA-binding domain-containing protein [archaeon]